MRSLSCKVQTTCCLWCLRMEITVETKISFHSCFLSGHQKGRRTRVLGLVRQGPGGAWIYSLSEWGEKNAGICPATRRCFSLNVLSWPATFFLPENYSAFFQTSLQSANSCILSFIVAECLPDSEKSLLPSGRRCSITNVSSWFSLHVGHVLLIVLSPALGS